MNLYKAIFLGICGILSLCLSTTFSQNSKRANNPIILMDNVAHDINSGSRIQDTTINDINPNQGKYAQEYVITNTFDALRIQIAPYLQWIMYIGLSLAVIGIIYNGFLMVLKPAGVDNGDMGKVKTRLIKIITGVFLLTGFYVIIQVILGIISYILQ